MSFFDKNKKTIFILVSIACAITIAISIMYRNDVGPVQNIIGYVISPVQKYVMIATNWVEDKISYIRDTSAVYEENKRLKEELAILQTENRRLALFEEENLLLTELMKMDQKYPEYEKVGANIIAKARGSWYDQFLIDKGADTGLAKDMIVLSSSGLAGRIVEVGTNFSGIMSIIDDRSSVSVQSKRTGDLGVLKGDATLKDLGLCRLDYIDLDAQIMEGDEIVTSDFSHLYPPGLHIGYVKEVGTYPTGRTRYAIVQPATDFRYLGKVLIINQIFDNVLDESVK